jgi:hypothetical protein
MTEPSEWMRGRARPHVELHTDRPHAARVYDVLLGGKTNYAADRVAAERTLEVLPSAALTARQNRAFMHRAARYLAAERGVWQFLDIGTGIPTSPNLHEVVQSVTPRARVVYVDNDPIVLTHSRALHTSHPEGRTAYIHGDLRAPEEILADPDLIATLDLTRPVALTLVAVVHWLHREHDPHDIVARLLGALAPGSFLTLTHVTDDFEQDAISEISAMFARSGSDVNAVGKDEVIRFFDGLELVEPGVQLVHRWRPDGTVDEVGDAGIPLYAGVARKP